MAKKRKRGRPAKFDRAARRRFAELIRQHGARRVRELSDTPISLGTLLRIAREFDVELHRGRRRKKAA
jgi:hypothetical protein